MSQKLLISQENHVRLDSYISMHLPELSRTYIQKLIQEEMITVNGKAEKSKYKVCENDEITIEIPDAKPLEAVAQNIPLDVLYEDEHLIVVNKKKGMVVHPAAGNYDGTLVNALLYYCKGRLSDINGVLRPGIVHRIDKDTSGILVVAKTNKGYEGLSALFKKHDIKRVYHALVEGIIKEEEGTIDAPIGRNENDRLKMSVNLKNGKNAVTHFRVLKRNATTTLIEVALETGRTHQIRVHMAYIRHPIVGDSTYGKKNQLKAKNGQLLHASLLGFIHPVTGEYMEFKAQMPDELLQYE